MFTLIMASFVRETCRSTVPAGLMLSHAVSLVTLIVGGEMLDFMLTRLNAHARVVMCGAISDYSKQAGLPDKCQKFILYSSFCKQQIAPYHIVYKTIRP